jgi:hypothetical protein
MHPEQKIGLPIFGREKMGRVLMTFVGTSVIKCSNADSFSVNPIPSISAFPDSLQHINSLAFGGPSPTSVDISSNHLLSRAPRNQIPNCFSLELIVIPTAKTIENADLASLNCLSDAMSSDEPLTRLSLSTAESCPFTDMMLSALADSETVDKTHTTWGMYALTETRFPPNRRPKHLNMSLFNNVFLQRIQIARSVDGLTSASSLPPIASHGRIWGRSHRQVIGKGLCNRTFLDSLTLSASFESTVDMSFSHHAFLEQVVFPYDSLLN